MSDVRIEVQPDGLHLVILLTPAGATDPNESLRVKLTPELHGQLLAHAEAAGARLVYPPKQKGWPRADKAPTGSLEGFDAFWSAYPRKEAKSEAKRIWVQRNLSPLTEQIAAHVSAQSQTEQWCKEKGKFVPMPVTYLNQRRWEDAEGNGGSGRPEGWV